MPDRRLGPIDAHEQFALSRLQSGESPESIVVRFVQAGWPEPTARAVVSSAGRRIRPGGWWVLIGAAFLGVAAIALVVVLVVSALSDPAGPRAVIAKLQNGAGFIPLLLIPAPIWLVMTALVIVHVTAYRTKWVRARMVGAGRRGLRMTVLVIDWILVGAVPIAVIGGLIVLGVAATALGVMCGEAQSTSCGL